MKRFFNRIYPKSMAGQLIAVLLLALIVAQIASFSILHDDRRLAFIFVAQQDVMSRTVSVVRLLNKTDPQLHQTIVDAASSRRLRFQLADKSAVSSKRGEGGFDQMLQARLARELAGELKDEIGAVRVAIVDEDEDDEKEDQENKDHEDSEENDGHNPFWVPNDERRFQEWRSNRRGRGMFGRGLMDRHHNPRAGMTISVVTKNGEGAHPWLNVYSLVPRTSPAVAMTSLIAMGIAAFLLVILVILMVRRLTRPLAKLADSAERFGRGEDVGELLESGPEDIRQASRAFNDMQERLTRFVQDRTRMLAAITHDLRTPITSLRIRAEMIEDEEAREKILETLAEMQSLTEAALNFAREEATQEETRSVDLVALVDSLCTDLADLGQAVNFTVRDLEKLPYACRPMALKRALRNVIENAVRYGEEANVELARLDQDICIWISDEGPGVSEEDQERIFEPFVRLEESRSRETGGIGLGLAIARSIIRAQGGDITLANIAGNGACFKIRLPS